MKAVFGFGNPGKKYERTRHNVGFLAVDAMADRYKTGLNQYNFQSVVGRVKVGGGEILLVKPITFMNLVGVAVKDILRSCEIQLEDMVVITDDADLELGRIKISRRGGDAGHLGVRSVIENLGSEDFSRLRIGIGRPPPGMQLTEYVLQDFTTEEWERIQKVLFDAVAAVETIILEGTEKAMASFN